MKVYGDSNSGNCLKVKWVCDKLAISYDWIEIDILKGESRTGEFLRLNSAGQVPTVVFDDGRTLAQSNAIIKYLARDSELVPRDALVAAQMDAWLFWEQNSHEPFVAVCRFHTVYLGKPVSEVDPNLIKRGHAALGHMDRHLAGNRFMLGDTLSLADVALLAYTRVAPEGGLELSPYASLRRWIGESESELGLRRNAS